MPISISRSLETVVPAMLLRYRARLIRQHPLEESRPGLLGGHTAVLHEPVGVVAAIVPWNLSKSLAFSKIAPALAAGCTLVVKPSQETVLDAHVMADATVAAGPS